MDAQDLLQRYAQGQRDFSHADLRSVDLSHQKLSGIGLAQANLTGANLCGADLQAANLRQAILQGANLTEANLTGANLRRTNFINAVMDTACLDEASMLGAILPDGTVVETQVMNGPSFPSETGNHNQAEDDTASRSNSVPELPQHRGSFPPASALAAFSPVAASVETPTRPRSRQDFKTHLPWASFFFLAVSYLCFGILLGMHHATPLLWAIALFSALIWRLDEALTLCIPIGPSIAIILTDLTSLLSIWGLGWSGIAAVATGLSFKFILDRSWLMALRDGCIVGAVLAIAIKSYVWMLASQGNYSWGPISAPEWTSAHLSLLLITGVVCAGLGSIAWMQMQVVNFSMGQITSSYLITAGLGLLVGRIVTIFGTLSP